MSIETWQNRFGSAFADVQRDATLLAQDGLTFITALSRLEQAMLGGVVVLLLFYMLIPGSRADGTGGSSGRSFVGILLLITAAGLGAGWMMAGRISF